MEQPCLVAVKGLHIPGMIIARDDGLVSVRFAHDELTAEERQALDWKGKNRERIKVFPGHQVKVTKGV